VRSTGSRTRSRFDRRSEALARRPLRAFDLTAHDVTVPVSSSMTGRTRRCPMPTAFVSRVRPAGTLVSTEGLGHRRLLRDPGVVDVVARFVTSGGGEDDLSAR